MKLLFASLATALTLGGVPVRAQTGPIGSVTFEVRGGYLVAMRDLGRTQVLEGAGYVAFDRLDPTATLAAGIEVPLLPPVALRLMVDYALETNAKGQWFCDAFSPCPSVLILVDGKARRWSALGDLRLRPSWAVGPLRPTAFFGVGRREYRLRWESPVPEVPIPRAFDRGIWVAHTGVGAELQRGAWALLAEADVTIGRFGADAPALVEGTTPRDGLGSASGQVDVGLSVGARISLH